MTEHHEITHIRACLFCEFEIPDSFCTIFYCCIRFGLIIVIPIDTISKILKLRNYIFRSQKCGYKDSIQGSDINVFVPGNGVWLESGYLDLILEWS